MECIYLDHQATTPVDPVIIETMGPFLSEMFANVGSTHLFGRQVGCHVHTARQQIADFLGCLPGEVLFTSGATESNNIALQGLARGCHSIGKHIITSPTEHKAVLQVCDYLVDELGFELSMCPVDEFGVVDLVELEKLIRKGAPGTVDRTLFISIMGANNEIGTIQPIQEIGSLAKKHDVFFHVDAAQWAGKTKFSMEACGIDLLSISGHKIYGPKGVGALYINSKNKKLQMKPILFGGSQEKKLRPGTQALFLYVAMGKACELSGKFLNSEPLRLQSMRDLMVNKITAAIPQVKLIGHPTQRLAGNINLCFSGIDAEILMLSLNEVAVSTGSACTSKSANPSHVLKAIGLSDCEARSCLRIGLGRFNTESNVQIATNRIIEHVKIKKSACPKKSKGDLHAHG